jgi:hypothetical protein
MPCPYAARKRLGDIRRMRSSCFETPDNTLRRLSKKADPRLRPASVPQSRDGKEKARGLVWDDTGNLLFDAYNVELVRG